LPSPRTSPPYHEAPEWSAVERVTARPFATQRQDGSYGSRIAALAPEVVIGSHLLRGAHRRASWSTCCAVGSRCFCTAAPIWVHGTPRSCPYDETARREPFGDYGIQKAAIERYLLRGGGANGFPASILHPGHISGPGWAPINPAGNLDLRVFERLARGETLTLPGDGSARLQHVHADDVAQAFMLALSHPAQAIGEAFHVAAREPVTMRDFANQAAEWFGRDAKLACLPWEEWAATVSERDAAITQDHVMHSPCASIEKARSHLGFEPRFSAVDAVEGCGGLARRQ
jgi:nucleoside-diphosphate-sugar epimerase